MKKTINILGLRNAVYYEGWECVSYWRCLLWRIWLIFYQDGIILKFLFADNLNRRGF